MAHTEKKLSSELIYQGRIITVTQDTVELENGKQALREMVHHHGGAAIVPVDENGNVYLVRQFRYPMGRELLEIPAGKLEPGEDPFTAAVRELEEECGLRAEHFEDLHPIYPTVGYDTEVIHLYLATGLKRTQAHPDEDEFLDLVKYPLEELVTMILDGTIRDAKTAAGLLKVWAMRQRGEA